MGCHADGITYVVPVHYVYETPYTYAHLSEGLELNLTRKNPEACFEVDDINDFFNWRAVICWGIFEEIKDINEQQLAMQISFLYFLVE
ncbi:pyridoxamine 5'-phosphate oxidase family protein [Mucilaginibacter ginkgonis]|uniref:Pyridoxamine 5'-phosphate oxidase family protein n=1 Tax=Mucilaginibacter ginkgonis TaxID=2682091 RepID=A0A6I4HU84_9SPHI|nr:pyridoxamine 5'-phosphate oxidase family protein [Mucilaginibacter ginkgonis]